MKSKKPWKALTIIGLVLTINGVVFLAITLGMQDWNFFGVAIGCLGSGLPLLLTGIFNKDKCAKTHE